MRLVQLTGPSRLELPPDVLKRFWAKIDQHGPTIYKELGPCWTWIGGKSHGYGIFWFEGWMQLAHRISYGIHICKLPPGINALHQCDNPSCPRPEHLRPGTQKDNALDREQRGRHISAKGSRHGMHILSEVDITEIRRLRSYGLTLRSIGDAYGVSESAIHLICKGKTWRHVVCD